MMDWAFKNHMQNHDDRKEYERSDLKNEKHKRSR